MVSDAKKVAKKLKEEGKKPKDVLTIVIPGTTVSYNIRKSKDDWEYWLSCDDWVTVTYPSSTPPWHYNKILVKNVLVELDIRGVKVTKEQFVKFAAELRQYQDFFEKKGPIVEPQEFEPEVINKAKDVLEKGDTLHFILQTVNKYHKGDHPLVALKRCEAISPWVKGKPLHDYSVGESGKGKSDSSSKVLVTFPQESYIVLTDLSPKAPYYAHKAGLLPARCIIFFDDVRVNEEGEATLKALTSDGMVKPQLWTVKDMEFLSVVMDGTYSVFLGSVNPINDNQLKNRFILENPDESKEQDERVWKHQDKTLRESSEETVMENDKDLKVCQAITQILISEVNDFVVPFNIIWNMKYDRRLYPFFLTLIKCVAKHYKFQRKKTEDGKIICTKGDFQVTSEIWEHIKSFQATKSSKNTGMVFDALYGTGATEEETALTYTEISKKTKLGTQSVKYACYDLEAMGLVNKDKRDRKNIYWLSVKSVKNRQFTNLTDKGIACDGFDLSVIPSAGGRERKEEEKLKSYINSLIPSDVLTFLKKQHLEDTQTVKNDVVTSNDGSDGSQKGKDDLYTKLQKWRDSREPRKDCDVSYLKDRWKLTEEEIEKAKREGSLNEIPPGRFELC